MRTFALVLPLLALSAPAAAQMMPDFSMVGSGVAAITVPATLNPCPGGRCAGLSGGGGSVRLPGRTPSLSPLAGSGAATALTAGQYQPTPALARAAVDGYVSRIRQKNPEIADIAAREFGRVDYRRAFANTAGTDGFRSDNLSDAMAAYMMLAWFIVNGPRDPSRAEVAGIRRQFAARVNANAQLLASRAKLGEEMKLLFCTLNAAYHSSVREGKQRQYADGVARMIRQQTGFDLRAVQLTSNGFVKA